MWELLRENRRSRDNVRRHASEGPDGTTQNKNNVLNRTKRSQSPPTEFRRRPPERRRGHKHPHGRPRKRWLRELQTFPLSESPDNHRDGGWDTDIPPSVHAHGSPVTTPPPILSTPSPSFEKEEGCRGFRAPGRKSCPVSSAPVDKAKADRLQDKKRRRSTTAAPP